MPPTPARDRHTQAHTTGLENRKGRSCPYFLSDLRFSKGTSPPSYCTGISGGAYKQNSPTESAQGVRSGWACQPKGERTDLASPGVDLICVRYESNSVWSASPKCVPGRGKFGGGTCITCHVATGHSRGGRWARGPSEWGPPQNTNQPRKSEKEKSWATVRREKNDAATVLFGSHAHHHKHSEKTPRATRKGVEHSHMGPTRDRKK